MAQQKKPTTRKPAASSRTAAARERAKAHAAALKGKGGHHGKGFIDFIREQGIIGLAVGLAIGTVASGTVKSLVDGFINPIVQFIIGSREGLEKAQWNVELWGRHADFAWGAFVSSAITLLATALVIYLIIHGLKLDRLDKKKG